jgi:hypothetical protein
MIPLLTSSEQFYRILLIPVLRGSRYKGVKVQYQVLGTKDGAVGDEYLLMKSGKMGSRFGFEPYFLRQMCADDPVRVADFFLSVHKGRHPSTFSMLLSVAHQLDVKAGRQPGWRALLHGDGKQESEKPSDRLADEVDKAFAIDKDVKAQARKNSHKPYVEKKILSLRPHLLEEK